MKLMNKKIIAKIQFLPIKIKMNQIIVSLIVILTMYAKTMNKIIAANYK